MKLFYLVLVLLSSTYGYSQNRIPPPPCYANGNSGFGGAVGEGLILFNGEDGNPIIFNMGTGANEMNDILVMYIDTGAPGRNEIDVTVDDNMDDYRIAISNSNTFGNGSHINFPEGFEASYAIALDVNSGGLWSIPSSGTVGAGGLNFITTVNSTLTSSSQGSYAFNFNWEDIGLTITDTFNFVAVYVSNTGFSSDEGYGEGISIGTAGSDPIAFNGYLTFPGCTATLSDTEYLSNNISVYYYDNQLFVKGLNEVATIGVYDIMGREIYRDHQQIQDAVPIPIELNKNGLQFIVIESANKKKVLKVIPN